MNWLDNHTDSSVQKHSPPSSLLCLVGSWSFFFLESGFAVRMVSVCIVWVQMHHPWQSHTDIVHGSVELCRLAECLNYWLQGSELVNTCWTIRCSAVWSNVDKEEPAICINQSEQDYPKVVFIVVVPGTMTRIRQCNDWNMLHIDSTDTFWEVAPGFEPISNL